MIVKLIVKFQVIIIFFLIFQTTSAQELSVDSLQQVAKNLSNDTTKVNILIRLANEYFWSGQYENALQTATQADDLATDIFFVKGQGQAMIVCGQSNLRLGHYDQAQDYFQKATTLFTAANRTSEIATSHLYLGQVFDYKASYDMALEQYRIALDFASQARDSTALTKILNSSGITQFNKGNYEGALDLYLSALKMTKPAGYEKLQATIINNIGVVHVQLRQYEEALKYFHQYVAHMKTLKGKHGIGVGYMNIGEAYMKLGKYHEAMGYLENASAIQAETGDKKGLALSSSNLADVYRRLGDEPKAKRYYESAISLAREIKNDEVLLNPLTGISELFLSSGNYTLADKTISEARALANRIQSKSWLETSFLISAKVDSAKGDFRSAYEWFKRYSYLSDSLFNEEKAKQVVQMKELYESERKDKEIKLLSESNKLSALQQASTKTLFMISVGFLLILLIIIVFWLMIKTRDSKILKRQADELARAHQAQSRLIARIDEQRQELAAKNSDLLKLHDEKDGLIGVVVHDLRSPMNKILGLSNLVSLTGHVNEDQRTMLDMINKVCADGNTLIGDLLEISQYEAEQNRVSLESVNLSETIRQHLGNFEEQLRRKQITLHFESADIHARTNENYLKRIIDNLVSNAIKFSPAGKNIWCKVVPADNENCIIIVQDEGPGFAQEELNQLFQKFKKLSARPTGGESSTGLGLSIVKLLVEKIAGKISVESTQGKGATFFVSIPMDKQATNNIEDSFAAA